MITILCSPKPFEDESSWNQINAMRSWRIVHPDVEIIVFGKSSGALEAAAEVNALYIPEIDCSSSGAPSFNAMAQYAQQFGRFDFQLYANCDILLDYTILKAFQSAGSHFEKFLLVGERLDLADGTKVDVRRSNWSDYILELAVKGQLTPHGPTGADYFGFIRSLWNELPPVYMGRAMCDIALIHYCLLNYIPLIDASLAVLNIHQYHNYSHVNGGKNEIFKGEDKIAMAKVHRLKHSLPTLADSNWRFIAGNLIEKNRFRRSFFRRLELFFRYTLGMEIFSLLFRALQYLNINKTSLMKFYSIEEFLLGWGLKKSQY